MLFYFTSTNTTEGGHKSDLKNSGVVQKIVKEKGDNNMKKNTNTNRKEVKELVRKHILEYFTPEELKVNAEGMKDSQHLTIYHCVKAMVEGGSFLCYFDEVITFLNSLGINPDNKDYEPQKSWELYCHLIARDAQLIIEKIN